MRITVYDVLEYLASVRGQTHVRDVNLQRVSDKEIWVYAGQHGLTIVTKDADFHQMSFVLGHPPKVVWIRRGNCSTREIETILRGNHEHLRAFDQDPEAALLTLD